LRGGRNIGGAIAVGSFVRGIDTGQEIMLESETAEHVAVVALGIGVFVHILARCEAGASDDSIVVQVGRGGTGGEAGRRAPLRALKTAIADRGLDAAAIGKTMRVLRGGLLRFAQQRVAGQAVKSPGLTCGMVPFSQRSGGNGTLFTFK